MTAIAGILEGGTIWLGGDSAGVDGCYSMQVRSDPKVFKNGEFIFGYTSSFRMGQILQYDFTPPSPHEGDKGIAYMVKRFVPSLMKAFKGAGYQSEEKGEVSGGTFLCGYRSELYQIQCDYQVARVTQPYLACGCGQDIILGSLHATEQFDLDPKERITIALDAAESFSAGVRGPYTIISI